MPPVMKNASVVCTMSQPQSTTLSSSGLQNPFWQGATPQSCPHQPQFFWSVSTSTQGVDPPLPPCPAVPPTEPAAPAVPPLAASAPAPPPVEPAAPPAL